MDCRPNDVTSCVDQTFIQVTNAAVRIRQCFTVYSSISSKSKIYFLPIFLRMGQYFFKFLVTLNLVQYPYVLRIDDIIRIEQL
jgi:hypothetical protein